MTVYYLRADNGAIKIGYTSSISDRFSSISTASPLELELVGQEEGGLQLERQRHNQFGDCRIRGEWFFPSDDLDDHIAALNPNYIPLQYMDYEAQRARDKNHLLAYNITTILMLLGSGSMSMMAYTIEENKTVLGFISVIAMFLAAVVASAILIYDRRRG